MNGYNFTERVRKVLALAREEAIRLQHEYVGTEHILLALIAEGEGIAIAVLQNLSCDLDAVKQKVEEIVPKGRATNQPALDLPYTSRAKKVLELSMAEARDLGHNYVGTEHLLLGLIREEKGIAAQVLWYYEVALEPARAETLRLLGSDTVGEGTDFAGRLEPRYPAHLDALKAAPEQHRLLLENEHVRILETKIPPGVTTPVHTHRWAAAHYVVSWSHFVRRDESGAVLLDTRQTGFNQNTPQALWGAALPAHTVENVGSDMLHIVSVEVKRREA